MFGGHPSPCGRRSAVHPGSHQGGRPERHPRCGRRCRRRAQRMGRAMQPARARHPANPTTEGEVNSDTVTTTTTTTTSTTERRDFGSLRLRGRIWYLRYRVDGREYWENTHSTSRREAEKKLACRQAELG